MTPKKLFIILLVALFLTIGLTSVGVFMADRYLARQSQSISDLKADDALLSTELINTQRTRESLKKYSYINEVADEILPDAKNQSEVILLINQIGADVGVNIRSFGFLGTDGNPSEKTQTEPLEGAPSILVFPVYTQFDATFNQLIKWLQLAEQNQRKMQVSEISIGRTDEANILEVTMTINAYVEK